MVVVIAILVASSVGLVSSYLLSPREDAIRRRLQEGLADQVGSTAGDRDLREGPMKRLVWPAARGIGEALGRLLPQNLVANIARLLITANDPLNVSSFLFIWAVAATSPLAIILLIARANPDVGLLRLLVLGGFMVSFGILVPYGLLRRRARHRIRTIERALPDAMDLLLTCVEAGLGVDAAFAMVAERFPGPVGEVFVEYLKQVGLGRSRRAALEDIAVNSGVNDLIRLSASVAQAAEVGTTIGDVLRLQASELRTKRRVRAQEAAQRAPVLMVIPLALCFMPAMAAVVVVPSILHLLDFVGGLGQ